ncbi:unnamed protein product [Lactuca saligna]|uniref:Uncharacterized protein n=1 Tax=Lactuca saligna TaxID=75948 RepID=A0AA35VSN5_LACSI|nr:unnamed protein product [Lactuca saligna]
MEDTTEILCPENDTMNPALTMTTQVSAILVLSHVFQIFLKPLGQPAPLAQILVSGIRARSIRFIEITNNPCLLLPEFRC